MGKKKENSEGYQAKIDKFELKDDICRDHRDRRLCKTSASCKFFSPENYAFSLRIVLVEVQNLHTGSVILL